MSDAELTRDEIHDRIAWLKDRAREGADRLRAQSTFAAHASKLTDAESAAIARKRIDQEQNR